MRQIVKRIGRVVAIDGRVATVLVQRQTACAECKANTTCHSTECEKMHISVLLDKGQILSVGQQVAVGVNDKKALYSVLMGYDLPLLVFCVVCLVASACTDREGIVAVAGLVSVVLYYIVLFVFRRKLDTYFSCSLE